MNNLILESTSMLNASARLLAFLPDSILRSIAVELDPESARYDAIPARAGSSSAKIARYLRTHRSIIYRPDTQIWLYKSARDAIALLTSGNRILLDTAGGEWHGPDGYALDGERLPLVLRVKTADFASEYFLTKLHADERSQRDAVDTQIDTKRDQIENLRSTLPSKRNRSSVSHEQQDSTRKQINVIENQVIDLRERKRRI